MPEFKDFDKIVLTVKEFLSNAKDDSQFQDITRKIIEEESGKLIDPVTLKRNQIWSKFSRQIFGAEI